MLGAQNYTLSTHFLNYFVLGLFLPISPLPFFACPSLSYQGLQPARIPPPLPLLLSLSLLPQTPSSIPIWGAGEKRPQPEMPQWWLSGLVLAGAWASL